jgi:hypothetical protein
MASSSASVRKSCTTEMCTLESQLDPKGVFQQLGLLSFDEIQDWAHVCHDHTMPFTYLCLPEIVQPREV